MASTEIVSAACPSPRVPMTSSPQLFRRLCTLGEELVALKETIRLMAEIRPDYNGLADRVAVHRISCPATRMTGKSICASNLAIYVAQINLC